ncbi:undecaprenyl diphosphate synthase family protein [Streptomyces sp. NPDC057748]|uniref:undecaprenyl diphosphate synthase family protein n=1 Tax=Streptomyces sp. NPDC057748 TaxID=3346239 RepID=UPI003676CE0E
MGTCPACTGQALTGDRSGPLPEHIGLITDGNRRWARQMGMANPSFGHRCGAEHVENVLSWCEAAGFKHVTVSVCSRENLQRRGDTEESIEDAVEWLELQRRGWATGERLSFAVHEE